MIDLACKCKYEIAFRHDFKAKYIPWLINCSEDYLAESETSIDTFPRKFRETHELYSIRNAW